MKRSTDIEIARDTNDLDQIYAEIKHLGLTENLAELEAYGFTVIENALPNDTLKTARDQILAIAEKQTGRKPDLETGEEHPDWRLIPYLMGRHPVFQDVLLNEKPLALITYLMGPNCNLSSMTCHFKGPGDGGVLPLHTDTGMPAPLPPYSNVANINYAMVDYTKEGGCLAVVPESHKFSRNPRPDEMALTGPGANPMAVPVEVSAGSAVIWHGNLWHGSYPRTIPGLRLNLAVYFARSWWRLQERYGDALPADVIERHGNNPRFRQLANLDEVMGWQEEGPSFLNLKDGGINIDPETIEKRMRGLNGSGWHS